MGVGEEEVGSERTHAHTHARIPARIHPLVCRISDSNKKPTLFRPPPSTTPPNPRRHRPSTSTDIYNGSNVPHLIIPWAVSVESASTNHPSRLTQVATDLSRALLVGSRSTPTRILFWEPRLRSTHRPPSHPPGGARTFEHRHAPTCQHQNHFGSFGPSCKRGVPAPAALHPHTPPHANEPTSTSTEHRCRRIPVPHLPPPRPQGPNGRSPRWVVTTHQP